MGKVEQVRTLLLDPFKDFKSLNENERQALGLASHGFTNWVIADMTNTTPGMVAYYIRTGLKKLGVKKSDLPGMVLERVKRIVE